MLINPQSNVARARRKIRQSRRKTRGAAVVEFAFVAPLMILLTMGMLEMGRAVMVKQLMVNATRVGARMATLPGASSSEVKTYVQQQLSDSTVGGCTVTVLPASLSAAGPGDPVTVSVTVPAASISWIPTPVFTVATDIYASTTMRKEAN